MNRNQGKHITTQSNNNQFKEKSGHMHSTVATYISYKSKLDTRHNKNRNSKSNNKADRLWNIFQTKNERGKTFEKDGHHRKQYLATARQVRIQYNVDCIIVVVNLVRDQNRTNLLGKSYLRTIQHSMYRGSLSGEPQFALCRY